MSSWVWENFSQPGFTYSNSALETPEQCEKFVQGSQ